MYTRIQKIIISVVVIAVLFGGYVYFDRKSKNTESISVNTNTTQTQTTNPNEQTGIKATGNYTIEQVPLNSGSAPQPVPDLYRPVHPAGSAAVSSEAIVRATENILPLQAALRKDPTNFFAWMELAMYQKMAGDFTGAAISWSYALRLNPNDYVSPGNLGNLYAYFLKDNIKAEMYYKQSITNGPTQTNTYIQFTEFYRDVLKDMVKARAIVDQGLSKIPNDANLLQIKATLK